MDKYTTADILAKIIDPKEQKAEQSKVLISNDAYSIRESLELLINFMRQK